MIADRSRGHRISNLLKAFAVRLVRHVEDQLRLWVERTYLDQIALERRVADGAPAIKYSPVTSNDNGYHGAQVTNAIPRSTPVWRRRSTHRRSRSGHGRKKYRSETEERCLAQFHSIIVLRARVRCNVSYPPIPASPEDLLNRGQLLGRKASVPELDVKDCASVLARRGPHPPA